MVGFRKTLTYWIQTVSLSVRLMDCQKISLYLVASISFTRWILKYLLLGKTWICVDCSYPLFLWHHKALLLLSIYFRCNILKRVPNSALWLLRFPAAGEMRLRACMWFIYQICYCLHVLKLASPFLWLLFLFVETFKPISILPFD